MLRFHEASFFFISFCYISPIQYLYTDLKLLELETKTFTIRFREYCSADSLPAEESALLEKAVSMADNAYAPYSEFNVGAALLMANGEIVTGANQENAAYPSGICAERSALFYAGARYPDVPMRAIAIAAKQNGLQTEEPAYPCGACRQAIVQYEVKFGSPIKVIVGGSKRIQVFDSISDLIPFVFDNI